MARPIADTPVLTGKDSERFYERLANADKYRESQERIENMRKDYNALKSIMLD